MKRVFLLTGKPGTGKTSLIKEVIAESKIKACGFYTEEIRGPQGVREGFKIVTLNGDSSILAHVKIKSQYRVSKYGVDIDTLERFGVDSLEQADPSCELVVIDEIGKMELFSDKFRKAIMSIIESNKRLLGTIMLNPNPFADSIKKDPRINMLLLTREKREDIRKDLLDWLNEQ